MRSRFGRTVAVIVALVALTTLRPQAQTPAPAGAAPFDIVGFIDAATVTPEADGFSGGGTITVNGTTIVVPKNTLLQMPAFALTWQELFAMAPAPYGPTQSGLAKADTPAPSTTYEVRIQGNRVVKNGQEQYIAGLVFIAQQSLNGGAGYINYIDEATGEIRVGGKLGDAASGARVFINDPQGKFAPKRGDDARFTIDEDNPTVRSETGYPMCVPHGTNEKGIDTCPQSNRPRAGDGTYLTVFTTDIPTGWEFMTPADYSPNGTNPLMMAPFEIGDYITYSGNLSKDDKGDEFVLAHTVIANVGIFTQPGTQPTYVAIDVMLMGVAGTPNPFLPQEATVRTRIEGFTTDPSSFVMLSAIDVDPCTGWESERWYDMVQVDPGPPGPARQAGGLGAVAGRWRWRPTNEATFLPPTRMLRATSINGAYMNWDTGDMKTPAGLGAGVYSAPNFEFIFAENLGIGTPPVPNRFDEFPFLANGSGAYRGAVPTLDENGNAIVLGRLGQLDPWPGAVAPVAPACEYGTDAPARFTPVADAGPSLTAVPGGTITLDARNSRDTTTPAKQLLTYTWTAGAANTIAFPMSLLNQARTEDPFSIQDPAPGVVTLTLPADARAGTLLTFDVEVTNCPEGWYSDTCGTSTATTTVKVVENPTATDTLTAVTATWRVNRARLDVNATTNNTSAVLTVLGFGEMGAALPIAPGVPAPAGDRTYTQIAVTPAPQEITVRSSLGGTVTVPVTVRP
jgi:hypothetical protein